MKPLMFWNLVRAMGLAASLALLSACGGGGGGGGGGDEGGSGGGGATVNYTVTATTGTGGSISPASRTVTSNATAAFNVTPDAHYGIDTVTGCGGTLTGNTYTTGPVTADCSVAATFTPITHTVTANAGAHGSVEWASRTVNDGDPAVLTVTPDTNYGIRDVTGCGGTLMGNTYTTGPITADCTISATFAAMHVVSTSAGLHGSISPTARSVMDGTSTSFAVIPDLHYVIDSVAGCDGSLSGSAYTTGAVTADCTVSATFRLEQFTVNAVAGANGDITPASRAVDYNTNTTFTVTPNAHHMAIVSGCNGSLSGNTYTTGAITAACTVTASFPMIQHTVTATAGTGGSIDPTIRNINDGASTSFTVTPSAHYAIDSVTGCDGTLTGNTYTTGAINAPCTVAATFRVITHTVSTSLNIPHGTIDPSAATVNDGNPAVFTITPDINYGIVGVAGCGGTLEGNTYTTGAITGDCTVSVTLAAMYTIFTSAGSHGSITPPSRTVLAGNTASFVVTPDTHYTIDTVSGCDGSMTSSTAYTTGPASANCTVSATFKPIQYTLTATAGAGGSISPTTIAVNEGDYTTFTVTPDAGYAILDVAGCGGTLTGNTFTTGTITGACAVNATFVVLRNVSATAGPHGAITPPFRSVNNGTTATFAVTPDTHYVIDTVTGCDGTLSGSAYTTAAVTADCAVHATFRLEQFAVTASGGANGTITPASQMVDYGSTATFTVTPDAHYQASVNGCGGTLSGSTYTTGAITGACSVTATFTMIQHTVTASAGANGAISPTSATVNDGDTTAFTVTPDAHYTVDSVTGCGGALAGNTYTTGPVTAGCAVTATFKHIQYTVSATAGAHGSISPVTAAVNEGEPAVFDVTPDSGYAILDVTGCDGALVGTTYTTAAVTAACSVNATFVALHTVSAIAGAGGSITPTSRIVRDGTTATFTVTADTNYVIDSISGCGGLLSGSAYTTAAVTDDCAISATFRLVQHTVTATAGAGGSISPTTINVDHGSTTIFDVTPDSGYAIVDVTGCDGTLVGTTYTTGAINAACAVNATFVARHTVSTSAGANGTITPTTRVVNHGTTATFVITPDTNYAIDTVTGCDGSMSGSAYTTAAVMGDCTVSATFKAITHTVTATAGAGGSISPASREVNQGSSAVFTVTPDSGYDVLDVSGCDGALVGTTYTTGSIGAACTVNATFVAVHTVTATADANGSITPTSRVVHDGTNATFVVTPNAHYVINTVTGCDGSMSGTTAYVTGPVTADCAVSATFRLEQFTVTGVAASAHGTVSPATQLVNYGATTTLTITPDAHYYTATLDGCGGTTLAGNTFTTGAITGDCTVTATFAIIERTVTASATGPGTITPAGATVVNDGDRLTFTLAPDAGYGAVVTGCGGTQRGNVYTTAPVVANCSVSATFLPAHRATAIVSGSGGTISPEYWDVPDGYTADFDLTPDDGYAIATVTGCGGTRHSRRYTVGPLTENCTITATFDRMPFYNGQAAAVVIGQDDFTTSAEGTGANRINQPYGNPLMVGSSLYLGDFNNNRVLGFNTVPTVNGASADFVVGAADFTNSGTLNGAQAVATDGSRLFVAEWNGNAVAVYEPIPDATTTAPLVAPQAVSFRLGAGTVHGMFNTEVVAVGGGKLVVSDGGHHRVLIWNTIPTSDQAPSLVLGQADFDGLFPNRGTGEYQPGSAAANTLYYPAGVWTDGTRLVVGDQANHRVLIWNTFPTVNGQPADLVLGQADFTSSIINRGGTGPDAGTLFGPYDGVFALGNRLFVADSSNGRVLMWNTWPTDNGQEADAVLGKPDFLTIRDPVNDPVTAAMLHSPTGIYYDGVRLIIGDSQTNRFLIFDAVAP